MSLILPYHEDLYLYGGGFIKPNGEILPAYGKHERVARNYCEGEIVENPESGIEFIYPKLLLFKKSQLSEEEWKDYQLWLLKKPDRHETFWSDYLVLRLGFDKVEFVTKKTITTTANQPHIRFYNYYLMDWRIDLLAKEIYNPKTDQFEVDQDLSYLEDYADFEAMEEIDEIKHMIKIKERPLFFK